jgi:hypothetical protein
MKKILLILLFPVVGFSQKVYITDLSKTKHKAVEPKAVSLFTSESELPSGYEKVAIIDIKEFDEKKNVYDLAKWEASGIGANGIIQVESKPGGTKVDFLFSPIISIKKMGNYKYLAVRYKVNGEYPAEDLKKRNKRSYQDADAMYN